MKNLIGHVLVENVRLFYFLEAYEKEVCHSAPLRSTESKGSWLTIRRIWLYCTVGVDSVYGEFSQGFPTPTHKCSAHIKWLSRITERHSPYAEPTQEDISLMLITPAVILRWCGAYAKWDSPYALIPGSIPKKIDKARFPHCLYNI